MQFQANHCDFKTSGAAGFDRSLIRCQPGAQMPGWNRIRSWAGYGRATLVMVAEVVLSVPQ